MSALHLLICASRMTPQTQEALEVTIRDILDTANRRNAESAITGILIAHRGWFVQAPEGAREVVRERFEAISHDPRHLALTVLGEGPTAARVFGEWTICSSILSATDRTVLDVGARPPSGEPRGGARVSAG
jgi:hypothetical protein